MEIPQKVRSEISNWRNERRGGLRSIVTSLKSGDYGSALSDIKTEFKYVPKSVWVGLAAGAALATGTMVFGIYKMTKRSQVPSGRFH